MRIFTFEKKKRQWNERIEKKVKKYTFPPSSGNTICNIPQVCKARIISSPEFDLKGWNFLLDHSMRGGAQPA